MSTVWIQLKLQKNWAANLHCLNLLAYSFSILRENWMKRSVFQWAIAATAVIVCVVVFLQIVSSILHLSFISPSHHTSTCGNLRQTMKQKLIGYKLYRMPHYYGVFFISVSRWNGKHLTSNWPASSVINRKTFCVKMVCRVYQREIKRTLMEISLQRV